MAQELTSSDVPNAVKKILSHKGAKLSAHEIHVRRTQNKGFIARHDLRDKHGNPPSDGQRAEAEYSLPDKSAMLAHMDQHMSDTEPDPDDPNEAEEQE